MDNDVSYNMFTQFMTALAPFKPLKIDGSNFMALAYISFKYDIKELHNAVIKYITDLINVASINTLVSYYPILKMCNMTDANEKLIAKIVNKLDKNYNFDRESKKWDNDMYIHFTQVLVKTTIQNKLFQPKIRSPFR